MLRIIDYPGLVEGGTVSRDRLVGILGDHQTDTLLGDSNEVHVTYEWYTKYICRM